MSSFFIVSFFIVSFDMLSFDILSLDMLSFDIVSLDIVSFFMSSAAKAAGANAMARPSVVAARALIAIERVICIILLKDVRGALVRRPHPRIRSNALHG